MGLLECYDEGDHPPRLNKLIGRTDDVEQSALDLESFDVDKIESISDIVTMGESQDTMEFLKKADIMTAAHLTVDFLHRSLRDFLLTPAVQTLLFQFTQGPYNARMFYQNARLVQLMALNRIESDLPVAISLASYVLSTLAVHDHRNTSGAAQIATMMRPVIENLIQHETLRIHPPAGYLERIFKRWQSEGSTFLTLAIDFGLESYVRDNLTPQVVQSKISRPILDYILRPRFIDVGQEECIGNRSPPLQWLRTVLEFGADPNEKYGRATIWAHFLCYMTDCCQTKYAFIRPADYSIYFDALIMLLRNGAHVLIPRFWLEREVYIHLDDKLFESSSERFGRRFPNTIPTIKREIDYESLYAVSDLLESFRHLFGSSLDSLKALVLQREASVDPEPLILSYPQLDPPPLPPVSQYRRDSIISICSDDACV